MESIKKEMKINTSASPALFVSHGSPMNAIEQNSYTQDLNSIGKELNTVDAIVVISAHWQTNGVTVTASENLSTYHDFRGFPDELFQVRYPAKGAINLIPEIEQLIGKPLLKDKNRGLDHGAWGMLVHLFPNATIPILQISIDYNKTYAQHYELAKNLVALRNKNILLLFSGNVTHNFSHANFHNINAKPLEWAIKFDEEIKNAILKNDTDFFIHIDKKSDVYIINHPTPEHYIPLVYMMGMRLKDDKVTFPHMSWQYATMSMRHILFNS